jgi:hypothetical protein
MPPIYTKNGILNAIKKGIEKWKGVANNGPEYGAKDCALCQMFLVYDNAQGSSCAGCPIAIDTHKYFCDGTPYYTWSNCSHNTIEDTVDDRYSPKQIQIAKDMVTYLEGLYIRYLNGEIKWKNHDLSLP